MKNLFAVILIAISVNTAFAQWQITTGPSEPTVVALAASDDVVIAGCASAGSNTGGHRTLNNGDTWISSGSGLISKFNSLAIDPTDGTIYAGGISSLYQSFDNGATFTLSNNGLTGGYTRDILIDGANIYAANNGIYISTNGGFNWTLISPPFSANKIDKIGNLIVVATINSGVNLSIDNGSTWTNPSNGLPTNISDVKIIGSTILAATTAGVYISENNGSNWTLTNLTFPSYCIHQSGSTIFAGCEANGVYYSQDGGNVWIAANQGLTNLTVYSLSSNSGFLFAGTTGYVFRRQLSDFEITTSISNSIKINNEITLSPNPNEGLFTIEQSNAERIEIQIYDQIGSLVYSTKSYSELTEVRLSNLSAGIYIANITDSNNNMVSKKLIIK